jgi:hypothetical protein
VQLVGYDGAVERVALGAGTELAYTLRDRHCAGRLTTVDAASDRDGPGAQGDESDGSHLVHHACAAPSAPYCRDHTSTWACARCTGDCEKPLDNCDRDHVVYLAAFPPAVFKVGVTKPGRLETRLREQGADRAALLEHHPDGRLARQREAALATELTDRVRTPTKIAGLAQSIEETAWEELLAEFDPEATFSFDYGLELDDRPVAETLATGTVRGVQGRVLVLANAGGCYAVDLRDLLGYELAEERAERDLQASLGSF